MPHPMSFGQPVGDPVQRAPARPPAPVVLTGHHVVLRPLVPADAAEVVAVLGAHPALWTYQSTRAATGTRRGSP